jgi:hypothetical protein
VLPDGIFSNQKFQFWYKFEGLKIKYFGVFLTICYFEAIWCFNGLIGIFCGKFGIFFLFG